MSITYLEAIREAQAHALRDDPRVFIYGQDVGAFGGAFKATKNLARRISRPGARFAHQRGCHDGAGCRARPSKACGRSSKCNLRIFRPSASTRSSTRRRRCSGAPMCPAPSRCACPFGGTSGSGPFHSQSMEAIYAHYPGLDRDDARHGRGRLQHAARSGGD